MLRLNNIKRKIPHPYKPIQIQPMLRLNILLWYAGKMRPPPIQIQPMLRLNAMRKQFGVYPVCIQIQPMLRLN